MVPRQSPAWLPWRTAPRTRGDGPNRVSPPPWSACCSPHPRGWSLGRRVRRPRWALLPAPAGMVPTTSTSRCTSTAAPRTRGDGPVYPAMTLGRVPCSPHPRGWSQRGTATPDGGQLLPAPAGMVPTAPGKPTSSTAAPRTRGDGPQAHNLLTACTTCSPHPRGWSLLPVPAQQRLVLLPAPAGMVPRPPSAGTGPAAAPRTRGDGPAAAASRRSRPFCSPHPRGWSRDRVFRRELGELLPAPAGMVPRQPRPVRSRRPAPRTRGDGPESRGWRPCRTHCSPHPRGWSQ